MKPAELEARMRALEYYHSLRLVPGAWSVVRVDGRSFTRLTATRFEKPYDEGFRDRMLATAEAMLDELQGLYAFTESDEISVLLAPDWSLFGRKLEKVVSISAAIAASAFTLALGAPAQFDSRVWLGLDQDSVIDYFRWRQEDAARGALNGWAYWTLRRAGRSVRDATDALLHKDASFKRQLLLRHGIDFDALPLWQSRGSGILWERYEKEGFDPKRGVAVKASRVRLRRELELPAKDDYARFLDRLMAERSR